MKVELNFRERVWMIVAAIPYGQVTTYGDVARLAGNSKAARQVGGILSKLPEGSSLPWYRVVNRMGRISLQGESLLRQRNALLAEDIEIGPQHTISLAKYRWSGAE